MHSRTLIPAIVAIASGAALLSAAALPAAAGTVQRVVVPDAYGVREGTVGAAALLAKTETCTQISQAKYAKDAGGTKSIPVCGTEGAVFWKADMDIDCDGQSTTACNSQTDPWFLSDTAFHQSDGKPLNAEKLPFIVVPSPSTTWRYSDYGIKGGGVVAVIYEGKVRYGVVGDTGPTTIIGEASYAMAKSLGIDPDPATGGVSSGVTYILFKNSTVSPIESHSAAVTLGDQLAQQFVAAS
ncbi:glycoside hydrolase family 75 protein [Streptomyces albipurpureus]|uniref:Glycoside hydrolase family 75 protein n=1 Tax=Streptomyces albipurpureus TaxID=2897419 RepID=A0ABT0UY82_9ACTN|nr:glycoside hydrolase family 75 protein [Streptomyces sp. CWNU-1]MCM2393421.1 glycoside hydrolase family 75 protein [Streptomyces sp. CWNU-1]